MLETYKKGQGVLVRRVAFWGLAVLILWGGQALYTFSINTFDFMKILILEDGPGYTLPVLNQKFNVAFVICWAITIAALVGVHAALNRQRSADFLVDTDSELKKVTWPTWKEGWNSSIIVIVFVAFLTVFLVASDWGLSRIFDFVFSIRSNGG